MKFVFAILAAMIFASACVRNAADDNANKPSSYNGEYGKGGPTEGESCYVGEPSATFRCAEAASSDGQSIQLLRAACVKLHGKHFDATCTTEKFNGTCRNIHQAPGILVRYYNGWDKVDAQIDCGETFDGLYDEHF